MLSTKRLRPTRPLPVLVADLAKLMPVDLQNIEKITANLHIISVENLVLYLGRQESTQIDPRKVKLLLWLQVERVTLVTRHSGPFDKVWETLDTCGVQELHWYAHLPQEKLVWTRSFEGFYKQVTRLVFPVSNDTFARIYGVIGRGPALKHLGLVLMNEDQRMWQSLAALNQKYPHDVALEVNGSILHDGSAAAQAWRSLSGQTQHLHLRGDAIVHALTYVHADYPGSLSTLDLELRNDGRGDWLYNMEDLTWPNVIQWARDEVVLRLGLLAPLNDPGYVRDAISLWRIVANAIRSTLLPNKPEPRHMFLQVNLLQAEHGRGCQRWINHLKKLSREVDPARLRLEIRCPDTLDDVTMDTTFPPEADVQIDRVAVGQP